MLLVTAGLIKETDWRISELPALGEQRLRISEPPRPVLRSGLAFGQDEGEGEYNRSTFWNRELPAFHRTLDAARDP